MRAENDTISDVSEINDMNSDTLDASRGSRIQHIADASTGVPGENRLFLD